MVTAQGGVEGSVRGGGGRGHGSPPVPPHRLETVGVVLVAAQWHPGTLAATAKKSKGFIFTKHEAEGSSKLCAAHRTTFEKSTARIFILSSYVNSVFLDF